MQTTTPAFGDSVRIRATPETDRLGLSTRLGSVFGETTPSVTAPEVIGVMSRDYAINVFFEDLQQSFWFAEDLVEFVDHGAGTVMTLDGVNKRWVRTAAGDWDESDVH